jgi:hypothetical protein
MPLSKITDAGIDRHRLDFPQQLPPLILIESAFQRFGQQIQDETRRIRQSAQLGREWSRNIDCNLHDSLQDWLVAALMRDCACRACRSASSVLCSSKAGTCRSSCLLSKRSDLGWLA